MSWQPIDRAPKDGTELLGWDGTEHIIFEWSDPHGWIAYDSHDSLWRAVEPTSWMPLPPPPAKPKPCEHANVRPRGLCGSWCIDCGALFALPAPTLVTGERQA